MGGKAVRQFQLGGVMQSLDVKARIGRWQARSWVIAARALLGNSGSLVARIAGRLPLRQFGKFCLVGTSGLVIDMAVLHCLVEWFAWNVSLSKFCSAETAMLSNFFLNEFWTFRGVAEAGAGGRRVALRMLKFQAICGAGIGWAVLLLNLFHRRLGISLYAANLFAILLVTLWNFWMNAVFNWGGERRVHGEFAIED
jgi:dolichol-phosphate mannosyltransferase